MSRRKREELAQRKLAYMREQIERFVWKYYRVKPSIKLFMKKRMQRNYLYSNTIFPKQQTGDIEIEYDYDLITKSGNKKLLPFAFREAVRIGMWSHKRPYIEGEDEFVAELRKHNLPSFGKVAQTGMELHSYGCSKCKRMYIMQERKLTKSKDPSQQDVKTGCCGVEFSYFGQKKYSNEQLQKIYHTKQKTRLDE